MIGFWAASGFVLYNIDKRGTFGDMFGAVNALFSGLALAGVIYAILLQHRELGIQIEELELTRAAMQRSASLPVVVDLFREFRTEEQRTSRDFVTHKLGSVTHGPVSLLAPDVRDHVERVSHFFDNLGLLVAYDLANEALVAGFMGSSALHSWTAIEPFIRAERESRGSGYQEYFEDLVSRLRVRPPAARWLSLGKVLTNAAQQPVAADGADRRR